VYVPAVDSFARFINSMSDQDWSWWPFLHLRPPADVTFTRGRLLLVIAHFAPMLGGIVALLLWRLGGRTLETNVWIDLAAILGLVIGMYVAAKCWNHRARQLRAAATK
jgi:hypothetical protein